MHKQSKKWSESEQVFQTKSNQSRTRGIIQLGEKLKLDPQFKRRNEERICKFCYYNVQGVMQAFTTTQCGKCQNDMTFPNSNVDRLCYECSKETKSCKHCGGEMD